MNYSHSLNLPPKAGLTTENPAGPQVGFDCLAGRPIRQLRTPAEEIAAIRDQIRSARALQYNASQARDARGVFAMERELTGLYARLDSLIRSL